jgi:nitrogen fixation protein NifB
VEAYALEFIEQSTLAWFREYLGKLRSGELAHVARGDADIRQGAFTAA